MSSAGSGCGRFFQGQTEPFQAAEKGRLAQVLVLGRASQADHLPAGQSGGRHPGLVASSFAPRSNSNATVMRREGDLPDLEAAAPPGLDGHSC